MSRYQLIKMSHEKDDRQQTIVLDTSTWKEMEWFTKATAEQKDRMKQFLLNLDKAKRVDPNSDRQNIILKGMKRIMESICLQIEQSYPSFAGRIIPMGSAHNNMKMGDSDEFDFVYELEIGVKYLGKDVNKSFPEDNRIDVEVDVDPFGLPTSLADCSLDDIGGIYCNMEEQHSDDSDTYFPDVDTTANYPTLGYDSDTDSSLEDYDTVRSGAEKLDKRSNDLWDFGNVSHATNFKLDLSISIPHILDKVMSTLELPQGWSHGGFNRPEYSGLRKSGPALMLQFDYIGTSEQIPLRISVDFVPLATLPLSVMGAERMDILNEFLLNAGYLTQVWVSFMADPIMYFSEGEEEWLRRYPAESVPKTAIRCCKALLSLVNQSAPKYPSRSTVLEVVEYLKQKAQGNNNARLPDIPAASDMEDTKLPMSLSDDFVSYSDLGEAGGHFEYLKSYMFKRTVMTMLALDDTKGQNWTEDDLPDLVMSVYMIMNDLLNPLQSSSDEGPPIEDEFVTEKLIVPLLEFYKTSDQATSADDLVKNLNPQDEDTSTEIKAVPPTFYSTISPALKECKCMSLLELSSHLISQNAFLRCGRKYAGCLQVCQLLQNVCEGKDLAEVDVFTPTMDEDEQDHLGVYEEYMTKSEFEKMLPANTAEGNTKKCDSEPQPNTTTGQYNSINVDAPTVQTHTRLPRKPTRWSKSKPQNPEPNDVKKINPKTKVEQVKAHNLEPETVHAENVPRSVCSKNTLTRPEVAILDKCSGRDKGRPSKSTKVGQGTGLASKNKQVVRGTGHSPKSTNDGRSDCGNWIADTETRADKDQDSKLKMTPDQPLDHQPKDTTGRIGELHPKTAAWQSKQSSRD